MVTNISGNDNKYRVVRTGTYSQKKFLCAVSWSKLIGYSNIDKLLTSDKEY